MFQFGVRYRGKSRLYCKLLYSKDNSICYEICIYGKKIIKKFINKKECKIELLEINSKIDARVNTLDEDDVYVDIWHDSAGSFITLNFNDIKREIRGLIGQEQCDEFLNELKNVIQVAYQQL